MITADALHTQHAAAEAICTRGGHYIFTVKTNQKHLHTAIGKASWARNQPGYQVQQKAHGRTSTWAVTALPASQQIRFPHASQIIRIHRSRTEHTAAEGTGEFVYAITSLPAQQASPEQLAQLIRGHWGIENRLHWVRDTAYAEDTSQVRTGAAAHVMASLRNLAISIHRLTGHTNITATLRHYGRNPELAAQLTGL